MSHLTARSAYFYVNGKPVNMVDPTGHVPCEDGVCSSIKFLKSPAGQAVVNAQAQAEQALAQQAQQAQSDYPGSRIVNGNQQIQLSNGAIINVWSALAVAQNSAAVDGQHFGAELLQQQISECMYDTDLYGSGTETISINTSASPYHNVTCGHRSPDAWAGVARVLNYVAGGASFASFALNAAAIVCLAAVQPECAGPLRIASAAAGGVSVAAAIGVTGYICANGTSSECQSSLTQTGLEGAATIASGALSPVNALPFSLVGSSASGYLTVKTNQTLEAIASRQNNPAPGQIVCTDNGGATVCLGSLG